jgi:hypothetical protein
LLSCLAHNLGSLVSPSALPECWLAGRRGLTWIALRGASHHWCSVSKATPAVDTHERSLWIAAAWVTWTLPLGLLWLGLDGSGSSHRLRCLRFDGHRPITSLCSLNEKTATFCAIPWAEASPNWLGVVSQCARFGTAAAEPASNRSLPEPPILGIHDADTPGPRSARGGLHLYGHSCGYGNPET